MYEELLKRIENLKEDELMEILNTVQDWAILHGVGMRSKEYFDEASLHSIQFVLLPSPVRKEAFHKACAVQTIINRLFHKLSFDVKFIENALAKTVEHDDFTRKLFDIYKAVKNKSSQTISLALLRSDYLQDISGNYKQVEMNTIASSMAGLCNQVTVCHRFVLNQLGMQKYNQNLPANNALRNLAKGILQASEVYFNHYKRRGVVLFFVEEITYNIADQRFLEFAILDLNPEVKVIRRSFTQLIEQARIGTNNELIIGNNEVSVVYYRNGYDPEQYFSDKCWEVRLLIENSVAVKCPSIQYHLLGTKKVQQVLSEPGVLEKYLPEDECALVRDMFVELYPLDESAEGEKGYNIALNHPESYVLKPQREGGGHNIYEKDIPKVLEGLLRKEASAYILMKIIQPAPIRNIIVCRGKLTRAEIVGELGIYGVLIANGEEIVENSCAGHMLRSKEVHTREAGVAAGFGALDSPFLV